MHTAIAEIQNFNRKVHIVILYYCICTYINTIYTIKRQLFKCKGMPWFIIK